MLSRASARAVRSCCRFYHGAISGAAGAAPSVRVDQFRIFEDNYTYIITDESAQVSAFVDPAQPEAVYDRWKALRDEEAVFEPVAILTTHHHWDHAGGNEELASRFPGIEVIGPASEKIPSVTRQVADGDQLTLGNATLSVIGTGGHTKGHVSYYLPLAGESRLPPTHPGSGMAPAPVSAEGALFCGDTLFVAGCGRLFEGKPDELHASLERLASLPAGTRVFCGHDYTLANMRFALAADPTNSRLQHRFGLISGSDGWPGIPSTIGDERETNPFLRCRDQAVAANAALTAEAMGLDVNVDDAASVFAALRAWKDRF